MRTIYDVGKSGGGVFLSCGSIEDLLRIVPCMPPGNYWIATTDYGHATDGTSWRETSDWGTLRVEDPDHWKLESLTGFVAGPGYLIA